MYYRDIKKNKNNILNSDATDMFILTQTLHRILKLGILY